MEPEDREEGGEFFDIQLDEELLEHYQARADAAGRTLERQINYELKTRYGLCPPDPGDTEAAMIAELSRRMREGDTLKG